MKSRTKAAFRIASRMLPDKFVKAMHSLGFERMDLLTLYVQYHLETGFFDHIEAYLKNQNKFKLTRAEAYAIWGYTTRFFYKELNELLRSEGFSAQTFPISQLIISGLKKLPAYSGKAWRHFHLDQNLVTNYAANHKPGKTISVWQFLSCGNPEDAALRNKSGRNIVEYYRKVNARDISELADGIRFRNYPPKELLIFPPKLFRVKDATILENIHYISLSEIQLK